MWELYALSIINELKTRASLKRLSEFGLDILYARAKTKLWSKIERLRGVPELHVADFGTRRRHSFLWQEYVVEAMASNLGASFTGTSNAFFAHKHDLEAIGTNAHEIPMVLAAIAPDDTALKASQYRVLELWQQTYEGALLIMASEIRRSAWLALGKFDDAQHLQSVEMVRPVSQDLRIKTFRPPPGARVCAARARPQRL